MASSFKIGTSVAGLVSLDALTTKVPDPKTDFKFYSKLLDLGSGLKRGAGYPTTTWTYGYLTQAQREQLRSFCTGASSEIYIQTRSRDEESESPYSLFKIYKAIMTWPEGEDYQSSRRIDFAITFTRLEVQTA